jgi:hypothetical protein
MERTATDILLECGFVVNGRGILQTNDQPDETGSVQFIAWEDVRGISSYQTGPNIKIIVKQSIDPSVGQGMFFKSIADVIIVYKYLRKQFVDHVIKTE